MNSKRNKYSILFSKYISQAVLFFSLLFCFIGNASLLNKVNFYSSEYAAIKNDLSNQKHLEQKNNLPNHLVFVEIEKELEEEDDDDDKDELFEINSDNNTLKTSLVSNSELNALNQTHSSKVPFYLLFHCWKDAII